MYIKKFVPYNIKKTKLKKLRATQMIIYKAKLKAPQDNLTAIRSFSGSLGVHARDKNQEQEDFRRPNPPLIHVCAHRTPYPRRTISARPTWGPPIYSRISRNIAPAAYLACPSAFPLGFALGRSQRRCAPGAFASYLRGRATLSAGRGARMVNKDN